MEDSDQIQLFDETSPLEPIDTFPANQAQEESKVEEEQPNQGPTPFGAKQGKPERDVVDNFLLETIINYGGKEDGAGFERKLPEIGNFVDENGKPLPFIAPRKWFDAKFNEKILKEFNLESKLTLTGEVNWTGFPPHNCSKT